MQPEQLLKRLDEIGRSLEQSGSGLALIGLGSVGRELTRLDEWSDLDFFAIVEPGSKPDFLRDLGWLNRLCPIAYAFANTADGYKLLFADGIFCEFAVFEPAELESIPFAEGRVVWKQAQVPDAICQPVVKLRNEAVQGVDWLIGEALTNLYVGLGRDRRGEHLSAMRFIQVYAVDRLLEWVERWGEAPADLRDPFVLERRFEQRHADYADLVAQWTQGYTRNRESALAILAFLEQRVDVNPAIAQAIRALCEPV